MVDINGVCKTITNLSRGIIQLAIKILECFLHRGEWWRKIDNGARRGSCCAVLLKALKTSTKSRLNRRVEEPRNLLVGAQNSITHFSDKIKLLPAQSASKHKSFRH